VPGQKCVESQIMDWADDVAYSVHDLEDGIQAGLVSLALLEDGAERDQVVSLARGTYSDASAEELHAAFERLQALECWVRGYDGSMGSLVVLKRMTSELIGRLCGAALRATWDNAEGTPLRRYGGQLVVPDDARAECAVLKSLAAHYVMNREDTVAMQTRQREQLAELLHAIVGGTPDTLEPWLRESFLAATDDAGRMRVVVDQVASLTDTSALAWHERLVG
jgi:dGTPase